MILVETDLKVAASIIKILTQISFVVLHNFSIDTLKNNIFHSRL